jgi:hypothetical protein
MVLKEGECGLELFYWGYRSLAGSCEHGNEHSDSIKCGEVSNNKLLKKDSPSWNYVVIWKEKEEDGENYAVKNFMISTFHQTAL